MWPTLLDQLTEENRDFLRENGVSRQLLHSWKSGTRLPTEVQVGVLAEVCGVNRHDLQDEVMLLRAPPEQRKWLERVVRKSAGIAASLALILAVTLGSLTVNGQGAFSRPR